jgi:phosphoribosylaminoimidazole-succinocarboxamide synthase
MYAQGRREMYGHRFPDGLHEHQKLDQTLITPTTKAGIGDHDAPLSAAEVVGRGLLSERDWAQVSALALALFARGREMAAERGLILVDTKYEFGWDGGGQIVLADEIHTPDSSRFWRAQSYAARLDAGLPPERLDKDQVRAWVAARCDPYSQPVPEIPDKVVLETGAAYASAYEILTGRDLDLPDPHEDPVQRIRRNLAGFLR